MLAYKNKDMPEGKGLVSVEDIAEEFWKKYGRNFFRCGWFRMCFVKLTRLLYKAIACVVVQSYAAV